MQPHPHAVPCLLLFAVGLLIHPTTTLAQTPAPVASATASLSGRVSHAATGQYLNNARVAVQGTNLVAFTDESGTYRLDRVPADTVVLEVFYSPANPLRPTPTASPAPARSAKTPTPATASAVP